MRDIPSYLILFKDLDKTFQHPDVLEMVRLSASHDFMAFLAVSYRNTIMAGLKIIDARRSAVNTLKGYLRSMTHALRHSTIHILMSIAKTVMPAPPAPPPPLQQQRRLSVAVMSAPRAGYMPPSSSESSSESENEGDEDEVDDKSTAHVEPDYDEERYSTHSTPVKHRVPTRAERANISPRRITHPGGHPRGRSPTGPSPMRAAFPERSPPGVLARSPAVRLPVRGSLKRKANTPQQYLHSAVEQSPVLL
jgi:hypothetical protein